MERWLGLPRAASSHAADMDRMMALVHWLILILFVGWSIYFLYVLFRFRRSRNPKANYIGTRTRASNYVEGGVALAEAILLVGFSFPLWAQRVSLFPEPEEALTVRVVAEQFAWNVHYPGGDGVFGRVDVEFMDPQTNPVGLDWSDPHAEDDIVTVNRLYLPVNRPVIVQLSTKDVIHSFGLPHMRVKQDAIPGMAIPVWFKPTVTTAEMRRIKGKPDFDYEIACAQLCGIGHYRMRGFVTVLEEDEFEAWLAEQAPAVADEDEEDDFWG